MTEYRLEVNVDNRTFVLSTTTDEELAMRWLWNVVKRGSRFPITLRISTWRA